VCLLCAGFALWIKVRIATNRSIIVTSNRQTACAEIFSNAQMQPGSKSRCLVAMGLFTIESVSMMEGDSRIPPQKCARRDQVLKMLSQLSRHLAAHEQDT
jgi:hypothetical protein